MSKMPKVPKWKAVKPVANRVRLYMSGKNPRFSIIRRPEAEDLIRTSSARIEERRANGQICALRKLPGVNFKPSFGRNSLGRVNYALSVGPPARDAERQAALRGRGSHTQLEWMQVLLRYGNKCLSCGCDGSVEPLEKDHVVPVSQGGHNHISNIQPLCRRCNILKGTRDVDLRGPFAFCSNSVM